MTNPPDEPQLGPATIAEINAAGLPAIRLHLKVAGKLLEVLDAYQAHPGELIEDILNRMPEPLQRYARETWAWTAPLLTQPKPATTPDHNVLSYSPSERNAP